VLLRLGYGIVEINSSGHPDIVASRDGRRFCFEVEAETTGPRLRKLTDADLSSLTSQPEVIGYYALAISVPLPHWVLVPASKLIRRGSGSPKALLEALSDKAYSAAWTCEYARMLNVACRQIKLASFNVLRERALAGRGL
jgi:Holliday junction resolvase